MWESDGILFCMLMSSFLSLSCRAQQWIDSLPPLSLLKIFLLLLFIASINKTSKWMHLRRLVMILMKASLGSSKSLFHYFMRPLRKWCPIRYSIIIKLIILTDIYIQNKVGSSSSSGYLYFVCLSTLQWWKNQLLHDIKRFDKLIIYFMHVYWNIVSFVKYCNYIPLSPRNNRIIKYDNSASLFSLQRPKNVIWLLFLRSF